MARTLTTAATTEKDKANGAHPIYVLQIDWGGSTGTKYYAGEVLTLGSGGSAITTEGRVMDWGSIQIGADPGRAGGHGQVNVTLTDADLALKPLIETKPGPINKKCWIWLYFNGTTWPTDRIGIFGGVIDAPSEWDESSAQWRLTLRGLESLYNRQIGRLIDRDIFPDVICDECDGEIIPIVYGNPVRRVPSCIIERPGQSNLLQTFGPFDSSLYIQNTAADDRHTTTGTRTLVIGYPGNSIRVTGTWDSTVANKFNVSTRDDWQASGTVSSLMGDDGQLYLMIPKTDLTAPEASRCGYPLALYVGSQWYIYCVSFWTVYGSDVAVLWQQGTGANVGTPYRLGRYAGQLPHWQAGTPVWEVDTWKWVVNYLPSKSVDLVECKTKYQIPGGGTAEGYVQLNSSYYSVNLDDRSYNTSLGRLSTDPGLTTITMSAPPIDAGVDATRLLVTVKGITHNNTSSGTVLDDPADVIKNLLGNAWLGNVPSGEIDSTSFTAAATAITANFELAITSQQRLTDLCGELAFQAGAVMFWDGGQARIKKLAHTLSSGDSQYTFDVSKYAAKTLRVREQGLTNTPTQVTGKFRTSLVAPESRLVRRCDDAITEFGWRDRTLDMWAHQDPVDVAAILEFWLRFDLQINQVIQFDTFLNGVHLQPGDTITVNVVHTSGTPVNNVLGRVKSLRHQPGSSQGRGDRIQVECEVKLYDWTVSVVTPATRNCNPSTGVPDQKIGPGTAITSGSGWIYIPGRGAVPLEQYRASVGFAGSGSGLGSGSGSGSGSGGGSGSGTGSGSSGSSLTYPFLALAGSGIWYKGTTRLVSPVNLAGSGIGTGSVSAYNGHKNIASMGSALIYQIAGGQIIAVEYSCS